MSTPFLHKIKSPKDLKNRSVIEAVKISDSNTANIPDIVSQ